MWQPTSERLQVWRVNACRETDAHFPSDPARKTARTASWRDAQGVLAAAADVLSVLFFYLTCSVIGDKSVNHATHSDDPASAISIPRTRKHTTGHWVEI